MCVICYTGENQILDDDVRLMFSANDDGAGYAYIDNDGMAHYSKGYMNVNDFLSALPQDRRYLMMHFRIATSGLTIPALTHPFDVNNPSQKISGTTSRILFHNGIITLNWKVSKRDVKEYSDTFLFVRDVLRHTKNPKIVDFLLSAGFSKFAYYQKNKSKQWILYGKWESYHGMQVSNTSFLIKPNLIKGYYRFAGDEYSYDDFESAGYAITADDDKSGISEKNGDILTDDDSEKCLFCGENLTGEDSEYGICEECTLENGIFCEMCGERLSDAESKSMICYECEVVEKVRDAHNNSR